MPTPPKLTYIGGPTLLIEFATLRFLTDPTFDPAGENYPAQGYTLHKLQGPALSPAAIGPIDAVLLSHDHHFDNLDHQGRKFLTQAKRVLTTQAAATRLNQNAQGLTPWQSIDLPTASNTKLTITATPARHGPQGGDRGPCIGFILSHADDPNQNIYVSGDTVWFEGIEEIARRFKIKTAILFMGAAKVAAAGPAHLTFTAEEGVHFAKTFPNTTIIPAHFEGWAHFSEAKTDISAAFQKANLANRARSRHPNCPRSIIDYERRILTMGNRCR